MLFKKLKACAVHTGISITGTPAAAPALFYLPTSIRSHRFFHTVSIFCEPSLGLLAPSLEHLSAIISSDLNDRKLTATYMIIYREVEVGVTVNNKKISVQVSHKRVTITPVDVPQKVKVTRARISLPLMVRPHDVYLDKKQEKYAVLRQHIELPTSISLMANRCL